MTGLLISIAVLAILTLFFLWLTVRAIRARSWLVKIPGVLIFGVLTLLLGALTGVSAIGAYELGRPRSNPVPNVQVTSNAAQIARGQQFANLCIGCHSTSGNFPLDGGAESFAPAPLATLYAPNLTPGGELKDWSDGEIMRAVREGVGKDGRALLIMPSDTFHNLADADAQSIIAFLRSQPAVQRTTPERQVTVLGAALVGSGMLPTAAQAPITQPVVAPAAGPTADYGRYLVSWSGCITCHGANLTGGVSSGFGPPAGPNISTVGKRWDQAGFARAIRTGATPDGKNLDPDEMPWKEYTAVFSDEDLRAIYAYLQSLP
jgi:mono/diheme cytochrome c family protein